MDGEDESARSDLPRFKRSEVGDESITMREKPRFFVVASDQASIVQ